MQVFCRCRGAEEVQRCRGADVQRSTGAQVQIWRCSYQGAEVLKKCRGAVVQWCTSREVHRCRGGEEVKKRS